MLQVVLAVLPTFLLILAGALIFRSGFLSRTFWIEAERLIYFVLFPALLAGSVAKADLGGLEVERMAGAVAGTMLAATLALLLLRPALRIDGASFTSVYQGTIRMNTYLAFAVALGVGGSPAVQATAVAVAVFVPLANLFCVSILVRYAGAGPASLRRALIAILKNPLILSILAGIALNLSGIGAPPVLGPMLDILGTAALALGLLAVGAGLDFSTVRRSSLVVAGTTVLKLLAMPLLAFALVRLIGLDGYGGFAVVLLNAMPTAGAAYILARQLGGNASLMASIITVQTGASLLSLPLILTLVA